MVLLGVVGSVWAWLRDNVLEPANLTGAELTGFLQRVPRFAVILAAFLVIGKVGAWLLRRTFFSPRRVDPIIGMLFARLFFGLLVFVGFTVALTAFGINLFGVALTLAAVGAALALGMQNTVANLMGGVSLALDRPFEVGDRVQIGETWGDVEEIGLRSTKILTVRRELVTIPNRVLDQQEIWNYTGRYPELRIEVNVPISYDSDWGSAERLLAEIGRAHPGVLPFPPPRVLMREFGESGMVMELAVFIPDARVRRPVESDLRKVIVDRFRAAGIEIPFPHRTLVYKKDLPPPTRAEREAGPVGVTLRRRRLLVATAGAVPALSKAKTICNLASDLQADLVVTYITPKRHIGTAREGERAGAAFFSVARSLGVNVRLRVEEGEVVDTIARVVDDEGCAGVIIGAPRPPVLITWNTAQVPERLRGRIRAPVIVVPPDLKLDPAEVARVRAALDDVAPAAADTHAAATDGEGPHTEGGPSSASTR